MSVTFENITYTKVDDNNATVTKWNPKTASTVTVLDSVKFPGTTANVPVTSIAKRIFGDNNSLTTINIPDTVKIIGDEQFTTSSIKNITLSNKLIAIPNLMCYICGVTQITIPTSVTSIGSSAFRRSKLTSITIPQNVTIIRDNAFNENAGRIVNVTIDNPHVCTSVNSNSFEDVSQNSASSIIFNNTNKYEELSVTWKIIAKYFSKQTYNPPPPLTVTIAGITYTKIDATNARVTSVVSNIVTANIESSVTFPGETDTIPVTSMSSNLFTGNTFLTEVRLSSNFTTIPDSTFSGCNSLSKVDIPNGITSIGEDAFRMCSNLTSIELPTTLTSLGQTCFYGCSNLTSIDIPLGVTIIQSNCFRNCLSLTSINIPSSVISLQNHCFRSCSSLTSINIPSSVTSLGLSCFNGCSSLKSITIPSGVTSIPNFCFYECSSLTSINIPSGVTSIGTMCFNECSSLITVSIDNQSTCSVFANSFSQISGSSITFYNTENAQQLQSNWPSTVIYNPNSHVNPPTITNFVIPNKNYGDAPFAITQPTSNSAGSFTYTSDNQNISIKDKVITIIRPATNIEVVAHQAAAGNYSEGTATTTFTVYENDPQTPATITNGYGLEYFLQTDTEYGNIINNVTIRSDMVSSSKKVLTSDDKNVTITKIIIG